MKVFVTVNPSCESVSYRLGSGKGNQVPDDAVQLISDDTVQNRSLVRCTTQLTFEWPSNLQDLQGSESLRVWEDIILDSDTRLYAIPFESTTMTEATYKPFHIQRADKHPVMNKALDSAPLVLIEKAKLKKCFTTLHLDVLAYASLDSTALLTEGLKKALVEQLKACVKVIETQMAAKGSQPGWINAYHFLPPGYPHHVTVLYPFAQNQSVGNGESINEDELLDIRKSLHRALSLPLDRPLLRVVQSLALETQNPKDSLVSNRLLNVHQGLPPSGIQGGSVHMIFGNYEYFHYMQDRVDDSGWGCAYRSLQTIFSWFQKQRYIGRDPPTHREIQSTLVSLGDKPAEFVGSRQWIGAIELGFVLETLIGVQSKILTVPSGDDMPSKARELCAHFDSQGTPVMIGGGVLAYTLLGVHFNQDTGDCAFLILDPHYTGVDDVLKVRAGQWVAWKRAGEKAAAGGELFVSGAFYNILCPQRPATV